jgi:hypothetical protein
LARCIPPPRETTRAGSRVNWITELRGEAEDDWVKAKDDVEKAKDDGEKAKDDGEKAKDDQVKAKDDQVKVKDDDKDDEVVLLPGPKPKNAVNPSLLKYKQDLTAYLLELLKEEPIVKAIREHAGKDTLNPSGTTAKPVTFAQHMEWVAGYSLVVAKYSTTAKIPGLPASLKSDRSVSADKKISKDVWATIFGRGHEFPGFCERAMNTLTEYRANTQDGDAKLNDFLAMKALPQGKHGLPLTVGVQAFNTQLRRALLTDKSAGSQAAEGAEGKGAAVS